MHRIRKGAPGARRRVGLALVMAGVGLLLLGTQPAGAGVSSVGVRYGFSDAQGDLFEGSGDLGGGDLVGIHLVLGLLPLLEVELAGEYVSESLAFEEGVFAGVKTVGEADYEDLTLYLTGRVDVIGLALLPLKGYLGGGLNVHYAQVDVGKVEPAEELTGEIEEAIKKATGEQTEVGWHLVAGVRLSLAGLPAALFLEGRYTDPFNGDGVPSTKAVYAGLSLTL